MSSAFDSRCSANPSPRFMSCSLHAVGVCIQFHHSCTRSTCLTVDVGPSSASSFFRFRKPLLVKSGRFGFMHRAVKNRSALLCSTWIRKNRRSRDGSVGIATRYGLDGPGIESRWGGIFPHPSRPVLGPTQPRIQWVPGLSSFLLETESTPRP